MTCVRCGQEIIDGQFCHKVEQMGAPQEMDGWALQSSLWAHLDCPTT